MMNASYYGVIENKLQWNPETDRHFFPYAPQLRDVGTPFFAARLRPLTI
ncbi:hypothetical protein ACFPPD_06105 [Cohnella suwonensis]|uniref:Uncharacterized protein n=1 Tax=Cohnella suwonensis TaxID=696072 RepID=A0ABW0LTH0_9BACL